MYSRPIQIIEAVSGTREAKFVKQTRQRKCDSTRMGKRAHLTVTTVHINVSTTCWAQQVLGDIVESVTPKLDGVVLPQMRPLAGREWHRCVPLTE